MSTLIGKEVFNTRNNTRATIVATDKDTITLDISGQLKAVAVSTFRRWYKDVPEDAQEDEVEQTEEEVEDKVEDKVEQPAIPGMGLELRNKFINIIKSLELPEVNIFVNNDKRTDIVKYNGKNVFECNYTKTKFNVLAHPESLTPDNRKRADKLFPKEWGWALRAKFTFTELTQTGLMKSIITDGFYYRKGSL